jgi:hypothetical protein
MIIFLKKEFLALVLSGKKTQTIRAWRKCSLQPGSKIKINFSISGEVIKIKEKYFDEIIEEEAKKDGFHSLKNLKDWFIINNYPRTEKLFLIEFKLLSP